MAAPKGTKKVTILGALVPISRADGTSYPAFRDDVVTVPAGVAAKLVDAGVAELLGARRGKTAETAPVVPVSVPPESKTGDDSDGGGDADSDGDSDGDSNGDGENDSDTADGADASSEDASDKPTPPQKPAKAAKEATWREYAIAMGHDPDEAAEATRADLIAQYG